MNPKKDRNNKQLSSLAGGFAGFTIGIFLLLLLLSVPVIMRDWNKLQSSNSTILNEKDKFNASLEVVKTIVSGAGTIATIAGGLVLYLNFRVANRNAEIANRNAEISDAKLITERFAKAIEQLGTEKLEVCLGGIYSLEKIAIESKTYYWTTMEVLSAFIRERSLAIPPGKTSTEYSSARRAAIQAALFVIGRRDLTQDPLEKALDLSNANLSGFTISGNFSRTNFRESVLERSKLQGENTNFESADFTDANLEGADLSGTNFNYAIFTYENLNFTQIVNGNLKFADLRSAFLREANFENANLENADLSNAYIAGATFKEAKLGCSDLSNATFLKPAQWNERHWTGEDYYLSSNDPETYYEDLFEYERVYRPNFITSKGLTVRQIQAIKDYERAFYDKSFCQLLGLPNSD